MFIEQRVQHEMQRLLAKPGSEGMTASDVVAWAIELSYKNNTERMFGVTVSEEMLRAIEEVLELAMTSALTSDDWLAIHHVAEMVGFEDAEDDGILG